MKIGCVCLISFMFASASYAQTNSFDCTRSYENFEFALVAKDEAAILAGQCSSAAAALAQAREKVSDTFERMQIAVMAATASSNALKLSMIGLR